MRLGLGLSLALVAGGQAAAQAASGDAVAQAAAVGMDYFSSSDADHNETKKVGVNVDWRHPSPDDYGGLRIEAARFSPSGGDTTVATRVYYRFAGEARDWNLEGKVGSDGGSGLGALDVHNSAPFRQEYFLEREIVETRQGLAHGLYYTFAGAALDLPVDQNNIFTVVSGVQAFTGRNVRLHLRANFVHVLQSDWGLTAQIRTRYFQSSVPGEADYFSPREYGQILPTLQLRRRQGGWRYTVSASLGVQDQTGGVWRPARAFRVQVTSPPIAKNWALDAAFDYSNTPTGDGYIYDYRQFSLSLVRSF